MCYWRNENITSLDWAELDSSPAAALRVAEECEVACTCEDIPPCLASARHMISASHG